MRGLTARWLVGAGLAATLAVLPMSLAGNDLVWLHESGEWGAWGAYAAPDSDYFIFSFGCTDIAGGINLHVELPVFGLSEGDLAWIELQREGFTVRFDGRVIFNEMQSEHQVVAHAPVEPETFDALGRFLAPPGSFTATVPDGRETVPADAAAAEVLAAVREACLSR